MSIIPLKNELSIRILNNPSEILKYLQIGISIPILPEYHKYILDDLKRLGVNIKKLKLFLE